MINRHAAMSLILVLCVLWRSTFGQEDSLHVGVQPDGRIVVPTNQVLQPAGRQVTFPGRPVDLAFADDGKTLVVKGKQELVVLDARTGEVRQTLRSPVGFSVVGLKASGRIYVS